MSQKTISRHFLLAVIFMFLLVSSSFASSTWLSSIAGTTDDVPTRIAIDKEGNLYVTQPRTKNNLLVYNRHGNLIRTMYGLQGPIGVAIGSDAKIYIGNDITGSIDVYNNDFSFFRQLGSGNGAVQTPNSIAISSSGLIYVTDTKAHNVKVYNPDGTAAFTFGSWGQGDGKFNFPLGLAIDANTSEAYVTDLGIYKDPVNGLTSGARVQVFDLNGAFKRSFGNYGTGAGNLTRPIGVAIDADSRIYVSDSYQAAVQVFDGNGVFLETIVDTSHPMKTPIGVAIGKDKRIFIASSNAPAIEVYGLAGYTTMATTPSSLAFQAEEGGASPSLQDITITNSGEGTLNWTAVTDSSWLSLSRAAGSTDNITPTILSAGIQLAGLTAGTYSGSIKIAAESGAADTIAVTLTVIAPPKILRIKPSSLSFKAQKGGPNPSSQAITIENAGQGEMNWTGSADQAWLNLNTNSGIAPSTVSVNAASSLLDAGTYTGTITIDAPGAQGSPASVNVSLRVIDAGTVKVTANLQEAGFDITGPVSYSGTGTEWTNDEVTPGDYTINFKHITGYIKPVTKAFKVETGKEITIDGQYRAKSVATHIITGSGGTKDKKVEVLTLSGETVTSFEPFKSPDGIRVAAGDLDGSGIDKIIASDHKRTIKAYTSEGREVSSIEMPEWYKNTVIAVGDIDGDGKAEIIIGAEYERHIEKEQRVRQIQVEQQVQKEVRSKGGWFKKVFKHTTTVTVTEIRTIDQIYTVDVEKGPGRIIRVLGYADGKLIEKETLLIEDKEDEFSIALGDINGDGLKELLVADEENVTAYSINLNAAAKLTEIWTKAGEYEGTPDIATGDLNDDGIAEIALSVGIEEDKEGKGKDKDKEERSIIKILKGTGEDYRSDVRPATGAGDASLTIEAFKDLGYEKPSTVALGDMDGDGADEIIAGAGRDEHNDALIRLFESDGTFTGVTLNTGYSNFGVNVSLGRFR